MREGRKGTGARSRHTAVESDRRVQTQTKGASRQRCSDERQARPKSMARRGEPAWPAGAKTRRPATRLKPRGRGPKCRHWAGRVDGGGVLVGRAPRKDVCLMGVVRVGRRHGCLRDREGRETWTMKCRQGGRWCAVVKRWMDGWMDGRTWREASKVPGRVCASQPFAGRYHVGVTRRATTDNDVLTSSTTTTCSFVGRFVRRGPRRTAICAACCGVSWSYLGCRERAVLRPRWSF